MQASRLPMTQPRRTQAWSDHYTSSKPQHWLLPSAQWGTYFLKEAWNRHAGERSSRPHTVAPCRQRRPGPAAQPRAAPPEAAVRAAACRVWPRVTGRPVLPGGAGTSGGAGDQDAPRAPHLRQHDSRPPGPPTEPCTGGPRCCGASPNGPQLRHRHVHLSAVQHVQHLLGCLQKLGHTLPGVSHRGLQLPPRHRHVRLNAAAHG